MKQWFYMNNDLDKRGDIRDVIQWPIRSRFRIKRPVIRNIEKSQACLVAFNVVCSYICTSDLVQEHIAFKVWPLVNEWEMPNDVDTSSSQSARKGGLVYLKYTYRYKNQFGETRWRVAWSYWINLWWNVRCFHEGWRRNLKHCFWWSRKWRLNRLFNVIRFIYPDYCFPAEKGGETKECTKDLLHAEAKESQNSDPPTKDVLYWESSITACTASCES
jgi:hypothetical protein